ncbi:MAG TPA: sulfatase-like hydrolase/transferase [Planctomycetaceae bacterium]|nr:sulfatase-like hydrolase/transferase [Planctomycetaceae bacterium]
MGRRHHRGISRNTCRLASRLAAALAILTTCGPAAAAERPNILLITADNLGYGDLPCFNPGSPIKAPHLDRLAAEGARLTDFYTPSPTCSVSRACLLTGRVPERHGLTIQLPGIAGNYGRGLDPAEVLIPQVLGPAGYATGCFGKWNIGFAPGSRPTERGFDEFFGHASGNIDYYTHVYSGRHDLFRGTGEARVEGYSTDLFADAAIEFIRRHARRPWFVYLPFNAPHFPNPKNTAEGRPCLWQAPDEAFHAYGYDPETRDERERYGAVVTALDAAVGRVLDALDDLELAGNTFVFFYSDNGAFMLPGRGLEVASNAPLRDGGVTCWEGGLRVAALARWPDHIPAGGVVREPLWSPDLFIASARLAGATPPGGRVLDGKDPLPVLTEAATSPHRSLYFTFGTHAALRMGDWKIVRTRRDESWRLFHLAEDLGETTDLAERQPERVAELAGEFAHWERAVIAAR